MSGMPNREILTATPRRKLTYDDFVYFPDDGRRHELIDGEHYVTPAPMLGHQIVVGNLHGFIWSYLREQPLGEVFVSPLDVVFSRFDVVEPDLLYVSNEHLAIIKKKNVKGAPDLVVEVKSPSTKKRDAIEKFQLYERTGVREYWIVDPDQASIDAYRRLGRRFRSKHTLRGDETLTTPLLPGLSIPLSEIFKRPGA